MTLVKVCLNAKFDIIDRLVLLEDAKRSKVTSGNRELIFAASVLVPL